MTEKQLKAVWLLAQGYSQKAVAMELHIAPATVGKWKKLPEFQKAYDTAMAQIFKELSAEATATMADLMRNSSNQNVKLQACKDILSRGGYDAKMRQEVTLDTPTEICITISGDDEQDITKNSGDNGDYEFI